MNYSLFLLSDWTWFVVELLVKFIALVFHYATVTFTNLISVSSLIFFNVTNAGNTYLGSVAIDDKELGLSNSTIDGLAPGESALVAVASAITSSLTNNAAVTANPVNRNQKDIPSLKDVTATDPSEVGLIVYNQVLRSTTRSTSVTIQEHLVERMSRENPRRATLHQELFTASV